MKLSELKPILSRLKTVAFHLESGALVPDHFHVTEIGTIEKIFIDCGGNVRREKSINFQLWSADDLEHRLDAAKLLDIIRLSEERLGLPDGEIEVEYQSETIGKYALGFDSERFVLLNKRTACLAEEACGIPAPKPRVNLNTISCAPGSGCCAS